MNEHPIRHVTLALTTALLLCACTQHPAPEPSPTTQVTWEAGRLGQGSPAIMWPNGEPDLGTWTDDPWAQAVLTWNIAESNARNTANYSETAYWGTGYGPDLRWAADTAAHSVDGSSAGDPEMFITKYPGPQPMYILDSQHWYSEEYDRELGEVTVCLARNWAVTSAEDALTTTDDLELFVTSYDLERGTVTHPIVHGSALGPSENAPQSTSFHDSDCDPDLIRLGYFDPAPDYSSIPEPWDIIGWSGKPLYNPDGTETGDL